MYENQTPAATAVRLTMTTDDMMRLIGHLAAHGADGTVSLDVRTWTQSNDEMSAEIAVAGSMGEIFKCDGAQATMKVDDPADEPNPLAVQVPAGAWDQDVWNAWTR